MREQREPWLKLPDERVGGQGDQRRDPRFRTHVVAIRGGPSAAPRATPTEPLPKPAPRPLPEPTPPERVLAPRPAEPQPPSAPPVGRSAEPALAGASLRPAAKRLEARVPGAPPLGLDDLPMVSSADWVAKVGEAAKLVDVIAVFYTAAYAASDMFQLAFQTVINEVLPQIGRPYAVYRFCLDAEPSFVAEMAESLGLPRDNPITVAGFAWSGPGRRLFLIGDRALESRTAFFRFLRRSLISQQAPFTGESAPRARDVAGFERRDDREARPRVRLWGGRALAILAWCLFGTVALGAAAVGVAPQWAEALLHPAVFSGAGSAPQDLHTVPRGAGTLTSAVPPAARLDNSIGGSASNEAQAPLNPDPKQRATRSHARKKHATSALTWGPTYRGLPEARLH